MSVRAQPHRPPKARTNLFFDHLHVVQVVVVLLVHQQQRFVAELLFVDDFAVFSVLKCCCLRPPKSKPVRRAPRVALRHDAETTRTHERTNKREPCRHAPSPCQNRTRRGCVAPPFLASLSAGPASRDSLAHCATAKTASSCAIDKTVAVNSPQHVVLVLLEQTKALSLRRLCTLAIRALDANFPCRRPVKVASRSAHNFSQLNENQTFVLGF